MVLSVMRVRLLWRVLQVFLSQGFDSHFFLDFEEIRLSHFASSCYNVFLNALKQSTGPLHSTSGRISLQLVCQKAVFTFDGGAMGLKCRERQHKVFLSAGCLPSNFKIQSTTCMHRLPLFEAGRQGASTLLRYTDSINEPAINTMMVSDEHGIAVSPL